MKSLAILLVGCLAATALCAIADGKVFPDDAGMFPFAVSYDSPSNAVNVASFLDAPAGKHGFVRTDGERFVTDAGEIRFNGVNVVGPSACPCKADAVRVADRLAPPTGSAHFAPRFCYNTGDMKHYFPPPMIILAFAVPYRQLPVYQRDETVDD